MTLMKRSEDAALPASTPDTACPVPIGDVMVPKTEESCPTSARAVSQLSVVAFIPGLCATFGQPFIQLWLETYHETPPGMTQEEALDAEMRYVASKAAPLPVPAPFAVAESTATASALAEGHSSPVAESPTPPLRDVQDEDIEFLEERQVVAKKGPGGTWTKQCLISLRKQRLAHGVKISWPEVQKIMARQWPNDVWHLEPIKARWYHERGYLVGLERHSGRRALLQFVIKHGYLAAEDMQVGHWASAAEYANRRWRRESPGEMFPLNAKTASHLWAEMIEDVLEAEVIEVEAEL